MWQPNRAQWCIIWIVAIVVIFAWRPENGRSLGVTTINQAVDPFDSLPTLPPPLPMGLDDNGDAVAAHDMLEAEYYRLHASSTLTRVRMDLKTATDPLDRTTTLELLVGFGIVGALAVWKIGDRSRS